MYPAEDRNLETNTLSSSTSPLSQGNIINAPRLQFARDAQENLGKCRARGLSKNVHFVG